MEQIGMGAYASKKDKRTIKTEGDKATIYVEGGSDYSPEEIEHQHKVGICTAISLVQLIQKQTGKKYSADFQYLLQKKIYDGAWYEGSSILVSLKVAKNFGFLLASDFPYITENDRFLNYEDYVNKLKAIPDEEIERLKKLCVDKIKGYKEIELDSNSIAQAIDESINQTGILCRYGCGSTWWIPSWKAKDINPLRKPIPYTSGHAIIMSKYNYSESEKQVLANTWGKDWCRNGCADIYFNNYAPTEAFTVLDHNPMYQFAKTMRLGMRDNKAWGCEIKELQKRLKVIQTGFFGTLTLRAVKRFQSEKGLVIDGVVGPLTREKLNE